MYNVGKIRKDYIINIMSFIFADFCLKSLNGTKYSIMDQVKFAEDSL